MAGLSRQHIANTGTIFCRQFVVAHIFETFHVARRKNGKNAATTEDVGLNTYTEVLDTGCFGALSDQMFIQSCGVRERLARRVLFEKGPINSSELVV